MMMTKISNSITKYGNSTTKLREIHKVCCSTNQTLIQVFVILFVSARFRVVFNKDCNSIEVFIFIFFCRFSYFDVFTFP